MGRAELDKIFVRNYDLNKDLLGKISFAQMVYLMLEGRLPTPEQGRMIDSHADRPGRSWHDHRRRRGAHDFSFRAGSDPRRGRRGDSRRRQRPSRLVGALRENVERCVAEEAKETDLDAVALKTVEKRLANNQLIPGIGHGIHTGGDPRAERLFEVAQETKVYGRYCELLKKIGKIADQKVGKHLPVNVTGAIAAISLDMGIHWQMSKSFAILGRALGGLAHVGEEIRRPIARGISNLIRDNLQYEPEK